MLNFGWQPFEMGTQTATFMMWYVGSNTGNRYASNTLAMIGAGY